MTYASLLEAYGYERFAEDARAAGASSLIVADLPVDSHPELRRIQLVAPTSTDERLSLAGERTDGWLYLVSLTGTTGARESLSDRGGEPRRPRAQARREYRSISASASQLPTTRQPPRGLQTGSSSARGLSR